MFCLPQATTAHTRHYMPYNEGKNEKTTKVLDTFIQLPEDGSILVAWAVDLPPEELKALRVLVSRLGYLGRAESLVEAQVLEGITDRVHDALCKWSGQGGGRSAVFTGLDASGKPLAGHRHAHVFCEANGPRDAITHITVCAEMGFDEAACRALRRLNKVWGYGGHEVRLVLHGIGQPGDFADCKIFGAAKTWRCLTPFFSTRHAKTFRDGRPKLDPSNGWQVGSPGHDLLRLLAEHPNGRGAQIKQLDERQSPYSFGERCLRSLQFQTLRHAGNGSRGRQRGAAFTITFPEP